MESVVKLVMNSLYGKFGQGYDKVTSVSPNNYTLDELRKFDTIEPLGGNEDYCRFVKTGGDPKVFSQPIWACYVTAYARIVLHSKLEYGDAIYADTDSIITKKTFPKEDVGIELGQWDLEHTLKKVVTIKPKLYSYIDEGSNQIVKMKGCWTPNFNFDKFCDMALSKNPKVNAMKFLRFNEAMRRRKQPNEMIKVIKHISLEDNKRDWLNKTFNVHEQQTSIPIHLTENDWKEKIENE